MDGRTTRGAGARTRLSRELAIGLATFAVYILVNAIDWAGRDATAAAHARSLLSLERALHLDIEAGANHWLADLGWLQTAANYEYAVTYIVSAFGLLFWLHRCRPELYRWARTSFVLLNLLAMACFLAWPLMPPRLLSARDGYIDTVRAGHTWGSWGSPLVDHANTLAAMPSLHLGWALWVSAVLAAIAGGARAQLASAAHVVVTCWVIVATANHFLLDAVAAAIFVWLSLRLAGERPARAGRPVRAADAFFLHVESPPAPQHVGGVVLMSTADAGPPTPAELIAMLGQRLPDLPRLCQRLGPDGTGWLRARWLPATDLDAAAHLVVRDVSAAPDPMAAFHRVVAQIAGDPLPRDRPLWRIVLVTGVAPDRAGLVFVVHHVVADGVGTVAQARRLLDPYPPTTGHSDLQSGPGALVRAGALAVGLTKLATDSRAPALLPHGTDARRGFATVTLDLPTVRAAARAHGVRVTDVLLAATGAAVAEVIGASGRSGPDRVRAAVPLMVARPDGTESGNFTAAVLIDIPVQPMPVVRRLAAVASISRAQLRRSERALASRFVLRSVGATTPAPVFRAFARRVYRAPYFSAIVSNMPGPADPTALVGRPVEAAFPLVPLAPGAPIALGALSWGQSLCLGLTVDPALAEADTLATQLRAALDEIVRRAQLRPPVAAVNGRGPADPLASCHVSTSASLRRTNGSSNAVPNSARNLPSR